MRQRLPWIWTGLVAATSVVLLVVGGFDAAGFGSFAAAAGWLLLPVLFTGSGALILSRQPRNRIAWLLQVVAIGVLLDGAVQPFMETAPIAPGAVDYVMILLANFMWMVIFFPLFLLLYLFPDGRYLSRRWSWAGWLAGTMFLVLLIVGGLSSGLGDPDGNWVIENPLAIFPADVFDDVVAVPWSIALLTLSVGGLVAIVMRFRRSTAVVRTQIKWVLYAGIVLVLTYAFSVVTVEMAVEWGDISIGVAFVLSIGLIPISITAAILRYKLFEIDRIISRTLSYTVVVACLAVVYFGTVTAVTSLLPTQNAIAVAGSTLLVAALFNPLRKRIQRIVDHRFNRSAYQAQLIADEFAARLQESLTADEIAGVWVGTVDQALQPSAAGVWLNSPPVMQ